MVKCKYKIKKMTENKFEFKQGKYGDFLTINGKELTKDDILDLLNKNKIRTSDYSDLISKAEQMQKENKLMISGAKKHDSLVYYKGIDLGIDRIIRLIKRVH